MAKTPPPAIKPKHPTTIHKLPRLSKGTKIHKRPLLHPAIAPPRTGASIPKIVYISSSSPFISSVKRVRKYLAEIDKRAMASSSSSGGFEPSSDKHVDIRAGKRLHGVAAGGPKRGGGKGGGGKRGEGEGEEVLIKATGKAIEKALRLALFFQGQDDCRVRLRTGSVGAVDDLSIVSDGGRGEGVEKAVSREEEEQGKEGDGGADADDDDGEEVAVADETRIRRTSMLEVGVSLR